MRKDDSIPFDAVKEAEAGKAFYYKEDGDKARYSGPLGTFAFDKTQFELRKHPVPATGDAPATETIILKYIGTETDGRKISIPKGCTDISLMFAGTDITSAPRLPLGVRYAVGAFKDCEGLTDARGSVPGLPLTVRDASYMFAGCTRLRSGPDVPSTVDAMDGMYYGCRSLSATPSVGGGVGTMDYAFADCPSLKQAPRVPKGAVSARDVTACCPGIDAAKDRERANRARTDRKRYERSLDRKGLAGMVGSALAACLQCHALRKRGYGLLYAPVAVCHMRRNGSMGTTLASGVADVLRAGETMKGLEIADGIRDRERSREAARMAWKEQKLAEWDRMYGDGTKPTRAVRAMAADAAKDREAGLFMHMSHEPPKETWEAKALRYQRQGAYEGMEAAVAAHWEEGGLNEAARRKAASWYRERLDEMLAYYRSAKDAIEDDGGNRFREDELRGLQAVTRLSGGPLLESAGRMQERYHVLDEGDLRRFDAAMREMGIGALDNSRDDVGRGAAAGYGSALAGRRDESEPEAAPGKDPRLDTVEGEELVDPLRGSRPGPLDAGTLAALQARARKQARAKAAGHGAATDRETPVESTTRNAVPGKPRQLPDVSGIKDGTGHTGPSL